MTVEDMSDKIRSFQREDDPKDQKIKQKIQEHVFSGSVGKEMMQVSYDLQLQYYKDCLANIEDPVYIHERNQQVLKDLALATNSKIILGKEWLQDIPKGTPVMAIVNHFSIYKLTSIPQNELGLKIEDLGHIPPPPIHFSAVYPVAGELGDNLYDAHLDLPGSLGAIQEEGGFIKVRRNFTEEEKKIPHIQFNSVFNLTKDHIERHPNSLNVFFAEGETSGKRSERGPFDLEPFHSGSFVVAAKLGMPIVPIAQYFNPNSGFEIGVFKPIRLNAGVSFQEAASVAENTKVQMQAWLDERKAS